MKQSYDTLWYLLSVHLKCLSAWVKVKSLNVTDMCLNPGRTWDDELQLRPFTDVVSSGVAWVACTWGCTEGVHGRETSGVCTHAHSTA